MKRKRLIAYGGLFKRVRTLLNLSDEDDLEADKYPRQTVEELLKNPNIRKIIAEWKLGAYHFSLLKPSDNHAKWLKPGRYISEL